MRQCIIYFFFLFFISCINSNDLTHKETKSYIDAESFILSSEYKTSNLKEVIPNSIIKYLSDFEGSPFEIGDITEVDKISFTDYRFDWMKYIKGLNRVLYDDTHYLIVYVVGGVGVHYVIDYFFISDVKQQFIHTRYRTSTSIEEMDGLIEYLSNSPYIDTTHSMNYGLYEKRFQQ